MLEHVKPPRPSSVVSGRVPYVLLQEGRIREPAAPDEYAQKLFGDDQHKILKRIELIYAPFVRESK